MEKLSIWSRVLLLVVLASAGISFGARASCSLGSQLQTITFPAITVTPSEKGSVGTVLASVTMPIGKINYSCGQNVASTWYSSYSRPEMTKTSVTNVYSTNISGIGVRIRWPQSRGDNSWIPGNYSCRGSCNEAADKVLLEVVQTGNVTNCGEVYAGRIATVVVSSDDAPQNTLPLLNINTHGITVNVRSCSIYSSTNSIDLGKYSLADVIKSGFTGDKKDFSITVDCPEKTSAKITFEGKTAWGMETGVIENAGSAQNAYIKLYQKSGTRYTAKALNTSASFGSSASFTGKRTVTYAGEMYFSNSTRPNATAGSVVANIVYTLTLD
ncbi:fimbrial protein [Erwinia phyllosphaerae]|uniref:fimbrial protein n=1 Tax=Erwinia phyllosphaerae TaxID=2853256 RepID=UPI001FF017B7|nr:fimbrial protein [Erwinia phyllosphaerae]MBV4368046.1 hypothetical protein [Erwinia phyllosphaerae]